MAEWPEHERTEQLGQDSWPSRIMAGQQWLDNWDRTSRMEHSGQDSQDRLACPINLNRSVWTGLSGQDGQNMVGRTRQLWQDDRERTSIAGIAGNPGQDNLGKIVMTGQLGHVSEDRSTWEVTLDRKEMTGHPDYESKDMTAGTGLPKQNIWDRTARTDSWDRLACRGQTASSVTISQPLQVHLVTAKSALVTNF
jgi:hypothetical protein